MPPARQDPEIVAEQAYLDAVYERLEAMRASAASVAEAYSDVRRGGTHQARLERDVAVETTNRRLAALDIGETPLCFGRLDLDDGLRFYVGRLGVDDAEHTPLVVDWRAPVAEPFYRATAVERMGVLRRRHILTKWGREVVGLDDEVFDAHAMNEAGLTVMGEGALFAALERERTGRMGDIVATIQAEQDEAVRAALPGPLIVSGGPGTGKTAVALHRAAYLLYTHRRQLGGNGVLLIGPSPVFLRYIDQVLPSLGEDEVQLATITGLKASLGPVSAEDTVTAAIKGDVRMAKVLARALIDRQRPPRQDVGFNFDGLRLRLRRRDCRRIAERVRRKPGTHNEKRPIVERMVLDRLLSQYRDAMTTSQREMFEIEDGDGQYDAQVARSIARGEAPPPEWEREIRGRLRRTPEIRALLERMWPVLAGAELVHDLFSFAGLVRSAADGVLHRAAQARLVRPRSPSVRAVPWTDADVALVDEADALCGPVEAARPRRSRRRSETDRAVADAAVRTVRELGLGQYMTASDLAERFTEPGAIERRDPAAAPVRSRPRRRGPGPEPDAVANARPALPDGFVHARRRLRPGVACRGRVGLGRRALPPADVRRPPPGGPHRQLPDSQRDHGPGEPTARGRRAGDPGDALGAGHRHRARVRPRRRRRHRRGDAGAGLLDPPGDDRDHRARRAARCADRRVGRRRGGGRHAGCARRPRRGVRRPQRQGARVRSRRGGGTGRSRGTGSGGPAHALRDAHSRDPDPRGDPRPTAPGGAPRASAGPGSDRRTPVTRAAAGPCGPRASRGRTR